MNVFVVVSVSMIMLLRDFKPYGIIFMNVFIAVTVAMIML
jgi:hypothetical protein